MRVGWIVLAAAIAAGPATARDRHDARHRGAAHQLPRHAAARHAAARAPAAPAGAVAVPAGGLKIFCAARSPLLVRKFTQGRGTTVTVLCR